MESLVRTRLGLLKVQIAGPVGSLLLEKNVVSVVHSEEWHVTCMQKSSAPSALF